MPAPLRGGARVVVAAELSPEQRRAAAEHFRSVFPALTPLAVGPGHPFLHLRVDALHVAVALARPGGRRGRQADADHLLAVVQVPPRLPRLVAVPSEVGEAYALLEEIVAAGAGDLFPGHDVVEAAPFRLRGVVGLRAPEQVELCARASPELQGALSAALRLEPRAVRRLRAPL